MIKLNNVFYSYNPKSQLEVQALKNLNFTISEKKFTAIVGKTGCGKSTLIQLLNGLNFPTCGTVNIDEFTTSLKRKERSKKLYLLKKKVGLVFQFSENQLFEETVEKDVAFGPLNFKVSQEEALKIARESILQVGLDESFYTRSPFELSGGEKRKVAIAGILALKPDYLILDEPTVGLDFESTKSLLDLLKLLNQNGITIIMVTHDLNLVLDYADEVIVLKDGELVAQEPTQEFFHKDLSTFDLTSPNVIQLAFLLKQKGINLDVNSINNIDDLVAQMKGGKR